MPAPTDLIVIAYPWLKSLHVISVIVWMGAQFLLPFLLATQRGLAPAAPQAVVLLEIERKLIRYLMNPAMLAAFVFGALLATVVIDAAGQLPRWLALKIGLVFVLAALHGKLLRQFWRARDGQPPWSARTYLWAQWLHFTLLAGAVVLVVVKPMAG